MDLRPILPSSDFHDTPWTKNRSRITDRAEQAVAKSNKTHTNKNLICLSGGVGRTANALGNLGFSKVFNSDIRESHLNVGKTYYKNIQHVLQDYNTPVEGYDYFLHEDIFDRTYREDTYKIIANWNKVSEHLLDSYTYNIYRFNCKRLDQAFEHKERHGQIYMDEKFGSGELLLSIDISQVQDLVVEPYDMSLKTFETKIPKVTTHSYQCIGQTNGWLNGQAVGFAGNVINNGLNRYFDTVDNIFKDSESLNIK